MRKPTVVLVAVMVLLAGCSGGGGGTASPTDTAAADGTEDGDTTPSETPDGETTPDETTPDGEDTEPDTQPEATELLSSVNQSQLFANATELDATLLNGSQQVDVLIRNDTDAGTELIRVSNSGTDGTVTLYSTPDYVALRNTTSGDVRYGEPDGRIGAGIGFTAAFAVFGGLVYAGLAEWQTAGTRTVDGETVFVYETTSLNETAFNTSQNVDYGFSPDEVQSVDGEMVVEPNGRIHSITVRIEVPSGTVGSELSVTYTPVTVEKPDWVDESQAP